LSRIPISVLDIQPPGQLVELVTTLEQLGFHRYWASEHYSSMQSASPTIVTALAAGLTERMRVGTAGVLLRATSAVRVAADFAALELYYPGRIDLGIAGASSGKEYDDAIGIDVRFADDAAFVDRVRRVVEMVRGKEGAPVIGPVTDTRPQLWMCATSRRSAEIAARHGMRLAFHQYLATKVKAEEIAHAYRDAFVAAEPGDTPYFAIAGYGSCAEDDAAASASWTAYFQGREPTKPTFLGSPRTCAQQLADLAGGGGADEIVVDCLAESFEVRLDGLRGLAEEWV